MTGVLTKLIKVKGRLLKEDGFENLSCNAIYKYIGATVFSKYTSGLKLSRARTLLTFLCRKMADSTF